MYLRHIYFYVNKLEDPMELMELLKMNNEYIYHIEMIDKNNGVIIEKNPTNVDLFIYKQLQELIMEDFNFKITFYVGRIFKKERTNNLLEEHLSSLLSKLKIDTYYTEDLITYCLLHGLYEKFKVDLSELFIDVDEDLIDTVRSFIECNLNSSETAKKMYLHRNTLNYRIDKFYEITGINVRNFKGAQAIYLLLHLK